MALITKIKLTPNYDWKNFSITDITGNGITGYGANQDPIGYREARAVNADIKQTNIYITAPDLTETFITLNPTNAFNAVNTPKIITNEDLGFLIDETITDGIWKVEYVPYFECPVGLFYIGNNQFEFNTNDKLYFVNNTRLFLVDESNVQFNLVITNINFNTGIITVTGDNLSGIEGIDRIWQGIGTTGYTVFAKEIKECLDNKVADESLCGCECTDCELVKKYLLYDAMYFNCLQNNITKAQQIFDYLTKFCNHCGC